MTISSSRPIFRADHDGSSHFAHKVLVYVLQRHILRRLLAEKLQWNHLKFYCIGAF